MSSILLIQSDPAAARRLNDAIDTDRWFAVCGIARSLGEARRFIAKRMPDLLIADLRLPDGAFHELLDDLRPARARTLAFTSSLHDPHLLHALRSGADGFLVADRPAETTLKVVRQVLAGEAPIEPEIARQVLAHFDALNARPVDPGATPQALTAAEREMLNRTCEGYLPQEIARGLGITTAEFGMRVRALYRRMQFAPRRPPAPLPRAA